MALTFRIYRAAVIEDGLSFLAAKRNVLTEYITASGGADFWDWVHDARSIRYTLARCDSTVHALINADPRITAISGEFTDWEAWLDLTLASVPLATRNLLESDGFSISWATAGTTRRDALIYISRVHVIMQELRRLGEVDSLAVFAQGLGTTVGSLSIQIRNKVLAWMGNWGLDTTWIIGSTAVREVIHYVIQRVNWPVMQFGPHKF
jgi:hypothetical protein